MQRVLDLRSVADAGTPLAKATRLRDGEVRRMIRSSGRVAPLALWRHVARGTAQGRTPPALRVALWLKGKAVAPRASGRH